MIQYSKYLAFTAQLVRDTTRNEYTESTSTTVTTVKCIVYQQGNDQSLGVPEQVETFTHYAIVASTVSVVVGDLLNTVVDANGTAIMATARVSNIIQYAKWRGGLQIKQLGLEVP